MQYFFLLLALVSTTASANAFKWIDEDGVVNYGYAPPNHTDSNKIRLPKTITRSRGQRRFSTALGNSALDCKLAVANTQAGYLDEIWTARNTFHRGLISRSQLDQELVSLWQTRMRFSTRDCRTSDGAERQFYQCMANGTRHSLQRCCARYID